MLTVNNMDAIKATSFMLVFFGLLILVRALGPLCFSCSSASHARFCDTVERCSDQKVCGVTKIITHSGHVQYTSGCLSEQHCSNGTTTSFAIHNGHVTCTDCCNGDLCNNQGCDDAGPPPERGPYCFQCDYLSNPNECEKLTICQNKEKCGIESFRTTLNENRFSSGCKSETICHEIDSIIIGKRDTTPLCNACCSGDFCNLNCPGSNGGTSTVRTPATTTMEASTSTMAISSASSLYNSCKALHDAGHLSDGVYVLSCDGYDTFKAYCDMTNGGWTVIQRRFNGSVNFTRSWNEYADGFGDVHGEYWLGLEYIYCLTRKKTIVELDLLGINGHLLKYEYSNFTIEDGSHLYRLHLSEDQSIECRNTGFLYNNGYAFATYDRDHSLCSKHDKGGWWYASCAFTNINGLYGYRNEEKGMTASCNGYFNLQETTMKII